MSEPYWATGQVVYTTQGKLFTCSHASHAKLAAAELNRLAGANVRGLLINKALLKGAPPRDQVHVGNPIAFLLDAVKRSKFSNAAILRAAGYDHTMLTGLRLGRSHNIYAVRDILNALGWDFGMVRVGPCKVPENETLKPRARA